MGEIDQSVDQSVETQAEMGKDGGFLTPKAIGNRIKAKGLQKLRWYCQMCQKQCRDENGFKCHCTSESHQRQMLVFADNPNKFMDTYSDEFETSFLDMVKHRFGQKRVKANNVYKEFISHRDHMHMNSTCWTTLTDFIIYLGRTGKCKVDQTPKGWFFSWIDRDPRTLERQAELEKKERMDKSDDDKLAKQMEIQRQHQLTVEGGGKQRSEATNLERTDKTATVTFGLKMNKTVAKPLPAVPKFDTADSIQAPVSKPADTRFVPQPATEKRKRSAVEELVAENEASKEKKSRVENWLMEGIVVKVMNKKLADGEHYKKKGVIHRLESDFVAVVKMNEAGCKLRLDQQQLETVIPNPGGDVIVVNGAYRGSQGRVKELDLDKYKVIVEITHGAYQGKKASIDYEDVSKLA